MDQFWLQFWAEVWNAVRYMAMGAFIFWLLFVVGKHKTDVAPVQPEKKDAISFATPHFEKMEPGDLFSVSYQIWKIYELETDYDPATATHRLRISAKSVRIGL